MASLHWHSGIHENANATATATATATVAVLALATRAAECTAHGAIICPATLAFSSVFILSIPSKEY
jgi:hypothetical protein